MSREDLDLIVLGAGPAGLAHAYWRQRAEPDLRLRIIEAAPTPGGWVQTARIEGHLCELGPQALRPNDASEAFVAALGLEDEVLPADPTAKQRFVARDGRLQAVPSGPGSLLSSALLSVGGKLRLCTEPFRSRGNDPQESLAGFVGRRFGPQTVPLAEALASGVYGGDAHRLQMAAAFPAIWELEQEHGSLLKGMKARRRSQGPRPADRPSLHSFRGGMSSLIVALQRQLAQALQLGRAATSANRTTEGYEVTLGGEVSHRLRCRELVIATPARSAAELLESLDSELADDLRGIPLASIANVYLGFDRSDVAAALQGFGFLVDRREQIPVLGAIYTSAIFPQLGLADRFLVRVMIGGVLHPKALQRSDQELVDEALTHLRRYTGIDATLRFNRVRRAVDAIPQYVTGHRQRVARIRERCSALGRLQLLGNSYEEVSVVGQLREPGP